MVHIRREKMGYKSNYVVQILNDIVYDQLLDSISNTGGRHQQRLKLKQDPFFYVNAFMNSFFPSVIDTWNKLPDTAINAANRGGSRLLKRGAQPDLLSLLM